MEQIRVFEAFSGYGSQSLALKRIGIDFVNVGISEIDKYAVQAYNTLHGDVKNYGDVSKINWDEVPDFDLFTYSFPCTDISSAGQQSGFEEGSNTRSSLLWECRKAIKAKKPKYLLLENVKALIQKKFVKGLNKWQLELESYGYTNYTQVLNAKDYGVLQNRERLFMVSILNNDESYEFPKPLKLNTSLKEVLEYVVDEKYIIDRIKFNHQVLNDGNIYILGYTRDRNGEIQNRHLNTISNTIHTSTGGGGNTDQFVYKDGVIRRFTIKECFRLMGLNDSDIDKLINSGISNAQLYKMAGNSIVVDVLYHIFRKLFVDKDIHQPTLF